MLQRQIVCNLGWQHGRRNRASSHRLCARWTLRLVSQGLQLVRRGISCLPGLLLSLRLCRGMSCSCSSAGGTCFSFEVAALLVIPRSFVVGFLFLVEPGIQAVFG